MSDAVTAEVHDGVLRITLDDGKANALSHAVFDALDAAVTRAESDGVPVVIVGRAGRFSAGFHLPTMIAGPDSARGLVTRGCEFLMRLWLARVPVVAACTGHALAGGALVLLACDRRIGADGPFQLGLNEVAIGLRLPVFAAELARARLDTRALFAATAESEIRDPSGAAAAGFLDEVVAPDALLARAHAEAARLAALPRAAFVGTKHVLRRPIAEAVLAGLADDLAELATPGG